MFKNLMDLSYTRTRKEAFGFYIAYSILGMIIAGIISGINASLFLPKTATFAEGYKTGVIVGHYVNIVFIAVLSLLSLYKKRLFPHFGALLLSMLGFLLALAGLGGLFNLIPLAVLTTFKLKSTSEQVETIL